MKVVEKLLLENIKLNSIVGVLALTVGMHMGG